LRAAALWPIESRLDRAGAHELIDHLRRRRVANPLRGSTALSRASRACARRAANWPGDPQGGDGVHARGGAAPAEARVARPPPAPV